MASYTPNINLKKPTTDEYYNVLDENQNKDKIDTAIGNINSQLFFQLGEAIPQNADLNNYLTMGTYYSSNGNISATIANNPFTIGAFRLLVVPIGGATTTSSKMQFIIPNTSTGAIYMRRGTGTSWDSGWWKLQGVSA